MPSFTVPQNIFEGNLVHFHDIAFYDELNNPVRGGIYLATIEEVKLYTADLQVHYSETLSIFVNDVPYCRPNAEDILNFHDRKFWTNLHKTSDPTEERTRFDVICDKMNSVPDPSRVTQGWTIDKTITLTEKLQKAILYTFQESTERIGVERIDVANGWRIVLMSPD